MSIAQLTDTVSGPYTPLGVRVENFTPEQRNAAITGALSDPKYLRRLSKIIRSLLASDDFDEQTDGLIRLSKFEKLVYLYKVVSLDDEGDSGEDGETDEAQVAPIVPIRPTLVPSSEEARLRRLAEQMIGISGLPETIAAKLNSPKLATIAKGLGLGQEWLEQRRAERQAVYERELAAQLAGPRKEADKAYGDLDYLVDHEPSAMSEKQRERRIAFLAECEDVWDNPQLLSAWIRQAQEYVTLAEARMAKEAVRAERPQLVPAPASTLPDNTPTNPWWDRLAERDERLDQAAKRFHAQVKAEAAKKGGGKGKQPKEGDDTVETRRRK